MDALTWDPAHTEPVLVLLVATACYVAYHYGASRKRLFKRLKLGEGSKEALQIRSVIGQRLGGFVLLGIVPLAVAALVAPTALTSIVPGNPRLAVLEVAVLAVVVLPFLWTAARTPNIQATYPEIRAHHWTVGLWLTSAASWGAMLLGYEFLFRGFLLFPLAEAFGPWPAIAAVTAVYVAVHLTKDVQECVGSLFMGLIFGAMALSTDTFLAPFLLHWFIATASETLALRANPKMDFGRVGPS